MNSLEIALQLTLQAMQAEEGAIAETLAPL